MEQVTCKRGCGTDGLHWKVIKGKYKLFDNTDLIHICNEGKAVSRTAQKKATVKMLSNYGAETVAEIEGEKKDNGIETQQYKLIPDEDKHYFAISSTSSGIAITGDDKNTPIYIPKIAVKDLARALFDFF